MAFVSTTCKVVLPTVASCGGNGPNVCKHFPSKSRRDCLRLIASVAGVSVFSVLGNFFPVDSATAGIPAARETILNSVLGAYGLPTLKDVSGFTPLTLQYGKLVVQFRYPSSWVVARNVAPSKDPSYAPIYNGGMSGASDAPLLGRTSGLTVGDYRRAEGVSFYVSPLPPSAHSVAEVDPAFIADLVTPGDATGSIPEVSIVQDYVDSDGFRVIDTTYESTTFSGYTIQRKARTRATILTDGNLYALSAACSFIRWKKIAADLDATLQSFNVFIL